MSDLLQPDLWAVTLPAVRAARERGREYIASGKYVPRVKVTQYTVNSQGWSTTTKSDLFPGKDAPIEWGNMIGVSVGQLTPIAYGEVPELVEATRWVSDRAESDPPFRERVSMLAGMDDDPETRRRQVESEYLRFFVMELVQRAEALGVTSDDDLERIYVEFERARFADDLRGDLVVPIALTPLELTGPLQIASDVWIEQLDESLQRARAASGMYGGRVSALVIAAATHAVVIKDLTFDNRNLFWRRWQSTSVPEMSRVERALQCLHMVTGRDTGYAQVIVRPRDWADRWEYDLPPVWKIGEFHNYPDYFDNGEWTNDKKLIPSDHLADLPRIFGALEGATPNVQLAARRAMRAVLRQDDEDKTLDATIGIEALLLANSDREEVTHRMALRAAAALAPGGSSPSIVASLLKKVYAHRSAIVHGRARKDDSILLAETRYPAKEIATYLLRYLLLSLLRAEEPWTPESLDKVVLESLVRVSQADDAVGVEPPEG